MPATYTNLLLACVITTVFVPHTWADVPSPEGASSGAAEVSTISTGELRDFESYPTEVRSLITRALDLTTQKLTYRFGSSDPTLGGMDCSGTIYRLLQNHGIKEAPRQSDEMCEWVRDHSALRRTENAFSLDDVKFKLLQPGDLLFWTGTYAQSERKLPISHVMLYLGKRAKDGKPLIFGASDGRSYDGQKRRGVSVFDFKVPKSGEKAVFYGYGTIPGIVKDEVRKPVR